MLTMDDGFSGGAITPPISEDGHDAASEACWLTSNAEPPATPEQVNKSIVTPAFPPSPPPSIKARRDRSSQQREANRSKQFTTRLQRSATTSGNDTDLLGRKKGRGFKHTASLPADHGLKAIEPPHEQALVKMAFAEQQQWITVQQKTFTKW